MIRKKIWMPGDSLPTYATHLISAGTQAMTIAVSNGCLLITADMTTLANAYIYKDLSSITNYTIQTGDFLEYDVIWDGDVRIAIDLTLGDASALRTWGPNDQNDVDPHPNTDLSAYANGVWYRRKISLAAKVGQSVQFYDISCEKDTTGTYIARLTNIAITDGKHAQQIPFATNKYL